VGSQLPLLGGGTGNDRSNGRIYLFDSVGQLRHARRIGVFTRALGVAILLLALACGAGVQRRRLADAVLVERCRRRVRPRA
jgi:hypothetical protein